MKKASEADICFGNKIVKQGNSYCVRIPSNVMKFLELKNGDALKVIVAKEKQLNANIGKNYSNKNYGSLNESIESNVSGSNVSGSNVSGSNVSGSNVSGSNVSGSNVTKYIAKKCGEGNRDV